MWSRARPNRSWAQISLGSLLAVVALACLGALCCVGCAPDGAPKQAATAGGRAGTDDGKYLVRCTHAGALRISLAKNGDRKASELVVDVEAINTGSRPFAWDTEFASFMAWELLDESGKRIEPIAVGRLPSPVASTVKARFKTLRPGESILGRVRLTQAFRRLVLGHGTGGKEPVETATGYEETAKFTPPSGAVLLLTARYQGWRAYAQEAFRGWFGASPAELRMIDEPIASNTLRITARDEAHSGSQHPRLALSLSVDEKEQAAADHIGVTAEVRNLGALPVSWDNEFAALVRWRMTADGGEPCEVSTIEAIPWPRASLGGSRFVTIPPGEAICAKLDLARGFKRFVLQPSDQLPEEGAEQVPRAAREEVAKLIVPSSATMLTVVMEYDAISEPDARGFMDLYGQSPADAGFAIEKVRSNELRIGLAGVLP